MTTKTTIQCFHGSVFQVEVGSPSHLAAIDSMPRLPGLSETTSHYLNKLNLDTFTFHISVNKETEEGKEINRLLKQRTQDESMKKVDDYFLHLFFREMTGYMFLQIINISRISGIHLGKAKVRKELTNLLTISCDEQKELERERLRD